MYYNGGTPEEEGGLTPPPSRAPSPPPPPLPMCEADSQYFASAPSVPSGFKLQNFRPGTIGGPREEGDSQPNPPPLQNPLPPFQYPGRRGHRTARSWVRGGKWAPVYMTPFRGVFGHHLVAVWVPLRGLGGRRRQRSCSHRRPPPSRPPLPPAPQPTSRGGAERDRSGLVGLPICPAARRATLSSSPSAALPPRARAGPKDRAASAEPRMFCASARDWGLPLWRLQSRLAAKRLPAQT